MCLYCNLFTCKKVGKFVFNIFPTVNIKTIPQQNPGKSDDWQMTLLMLMV